MIRNLFSRPRPDAAAIRPGDGSVRRVSDTEQALNDIDAEIERLSHQVGLLIDRLAFVAADPDPVSVTKDPDSPYEARLPNAINQLRCRIAAEADAIQSILIRLSI